MAKNLKVGETITNEYGDVWSDAILVSDIHKTDFKLGTFRFRVDIYKDSAARSGGFNPFESIWYNIDQPTFTANFTQSDPITTLKAQTETYALLLVDEDSNLIYDKFE